MEQNASRLQWEGCSVFIYRWVLSLIQASNKLAYNRIPFNINPAEEEDAEGGVGANMCKTSECAHQLTVQYAANSSSSSSFFKHINRKKNKKKNSRVRSPPWKLKPFIVQGHLGYLISAPNDKGHELLPLRH